MYVYVILALTCLWNSDINDNCIDLLLVSINGGSSAELQVHAPLFECFYGCIFGNFDSITCKNFIVIKMQCLQYVFYSLLSLQKHRVCVKGHQTIFRPQKQFCAGKPLLPPSRFLNFFVGSATEYSSIIYIPMWHVVGIWNYDITDLCVWQWHFEGIYGILALAHVCDM